MGNKLVWAQFSVISPSSRGKVVRDGICLYGLHDSPLGFWLPGQKQ